MNNNKIYNTSTMMHRSRSANRWVIWVSLIIAMLLQIMPWPVVYIYSKPNWVLVMLIFWTIALPNRVNIGTGFLMGLIADLLMGSVLGVHTLTFSLLIYIVSLKERMFRSLAIWQQAIIVLLLSVLYELIIFTVSYLINSQLQFENKLLISAIVNALLWPFVYGLLQFLQTLLNIH